MDWSAHSRTYHGLNNVSLRAINNRAYYNHKVSAPIPTNLGITFGSHEGKTVVVSIGPVVPFLAKDEVTMHIPMLNQTVKITITTSALVDYDEAKTNGIIPGTLGERCYMTVQGVAFAMITNEWYAYYSQNPQQFERVLETIKYAGYIGGRLTAAVVVVWNVDDLLNENLVVVQRKTWTDLRLRHQAMLMRGLVRAAARIQQHFTPSEQRQLYVQHLKAEYDALNTQVCTQQFSWDDLEKLTDKGHMRALTPVMKKRAVDFSINPIVGDMNPAAGSLISMMVDNRIVRKGKDGRKYIEHQKGPYTVGDIVPVSRRTTERRARIRTQRRHKRGTSFRNIRGDPDDIGIRDILMFANPQVNCIICKQPYADDLSMTPEQQRSMHDEKTAIPTTIVPVHNCGPHCGGILHTAHHKCVQSYSGSCPVCNVPVQVEHVPNPPVIVHVMFSQQTATLVPGTDIYLPDTPYAAYSPIPPISDVAVQVRLNRTERCRVCEKPLKGGGEVVPAHLHSMTSSMFKYDYHCVHYSCMQKHITNYVKKHGPGDLCVCPVCKKMKIDLRVPFHKADIDFYTPVTQAELFNDQQILRKRYMEESMDDGKALEDGLQDLDKLEEKALKFLEEAKQRRQSENLVILDQYVADNPNHDQEIVAEMREEIEAGQLPDFKRLYKRKGGKTQRHTRRVRRTTKRRHRRII